MFKCLAFWPHTTQIENLQEDPRIFPREIKFFSRMWVPTTLFSDPDFIGTNYSQYFASCLNPDGSFKPDKIPMMSKKFSGSLLINRRTTAQGFWHTFKLFIEIPTINGFTHFNVEFPDMSFIGAAFGFVLNQITHTAPTLKLANGTLKLLRMWRDYDWLPLGTPLYYEIDNFAVTLVNAVPEESSHVSMSQIKKLPLRLALSQVAGSSEIAAIMENETLGITPGERRGFFQSQIFAKLMEKKLDDFLERAREDDYVISASDDVWLFDGLRPKIGNNGIKVVLYSSFYTKFKKTPTGCRNKGSRLHRIFAKSKKMRSISLFNPVGITDEGGRNCVLECLANHLSNFPNLDSPPAEEFWLNPEIVPLVTDTFDIHDSALLVKINSIVKFNIICYYEDIDPAGKNSISPLNWPIYSSSSEATPLRLLCYHDGNDVFGNPVWHACVVSEFGKLKNKRRCSICGEWFDQGSVHFRNCKQCDFCFKAYIETGNHYLTCKGRPHKFKKEEETTTLSPSSIDHKEWQLWKNVWFCDFECFQNSQGNHIPYLAALKSIAEEKTHTFWGENCLKEFIEFVIAPKNKVTGYLYCHNGSGYDFNIILSGMVRWNPKFKEKSTSVLMRGNKILTCQISTKPPLTLRDTYLLAPASLSRLCKDLKINQDLAKTSFDHSKVTSFTTATAHKEEVTKYCIQDVVALEQIFKLFSRAMWDIAPVLLQSSMSLASHALEMWKKIEAGPVLNSLVLPSFEIYSILREMYHGGRVLATLPKYDSELWKYVTEENEAGEFTFFDEEGLSHMDFVEICEKAKLLDGKECVKQVDVVSLYPHVMYEQDFPTGAFFPPVTFNEEDGQKQAEEISQTIRWGKYAQIEHDGNIISAENPGYGLLKKDMFRHCYKVDLDCPDNLIVAFLMRKVDDTPVQNLAPLRNYWVTGVELFEALKVGYTLKIIHAKFGWDSLNPIFKKYIGILFKIKEENKKDKSNIMYIVAKLLMNALSGKFGQKIVSRVTKLMGELPEDPDKEFSELLGIVTTLIESVDDKGEQFPIGFLFTGEKKKENMETSLPTHLSVFILAHSRRKMSKMLRYTGGYYDPSKTLMYTDTDSMVVTESTYQILKRGGFIGGKLGQLEDEFPKELIIAGRFLAPKCYCLAILKQAPNSNKAAIAYKIRAKGIPHRGDLFFANSYHLDEREFSVQLEEIEESISGPVKDLGKKFYVLRDKATDKITMVHPFINVSICDLILSEKYYLQVHFGSILKNSKIKFTLQSKWVSRSVGFNSWWNSPDCPRILKDQAGYEITSCKKE